MRLFNFWRSYPRWKPKKDGFYLCFNRLTHPVTNKVEDFNRHYAVLYYDTKRDIWIDEQRQSVFIGYGVYPTCRAPIPENRVSGDSLCERNDVIHWKKLPDNRKARRKYER